MTALEQKLSSFKNPSSDTEKQKQERAERMVRDALGGWASSLGLGLSYVPKGSYANNTNVRLDSDVDLAIVHGNGMYVYNESAIRAEDRIKHPNASSPVFSGLKFREQLAFVLLTRFGATGCDTSGKTAIEVVENSSRVKADIVPSFEHRRYVYGAAGDVRFYRGHIVYRTDGTSVINYPVQQHENGVAKNNRTGSRYKQLVRILKRTENELVEKAGLKELPSYFMECLVYAVPDMHFGHGGATPLTDDLKAVLGHIYSKTGDGGDAVNWYEPNGIKQLFGAGQPWKMSDARSLAYAAWNYYGLGS